MNAETKITEHDLTVAHTHIPELQEVLINIQSNGNPNHYFSVQDVLALMDAHTKIKADELVDQLAETGLLDDGFAFRDKQLAYGRCGIGD